MKIHIIGGPGSGKTYIATKLSKKLSLPAYDLEELFWDSESEYFSSQTHPAKREEKLNYILGQEHWIIEGVYYSWLKDSFDKADYIFVLKTNVYVRDWRIIKRFILRKIGIVPTPRKENFRSLLNLLKWNHEYDGNDLAKAVKLMKKQNDKVYILSKSEDVFKLFSKRKKK